MRWQKQILLALTTLGLAACAGSSPDVTGAGPAVFAYLEAKAQGNSDLAVQRACPAFEAQARTETASFKSMNAQLDQVACTATGDLTDNTVPVACTGKITTTYQGESRAWPVDNQTYLALWSDGAWLMCGYQ